MPLDRPFGRYTLRERIGMGGMAEIFRATTTGPGEFEMEVCIKRILPHCSEEKDFVRMFIDEARLAARLRHANIVQILDFDVVDGSYFIAMELVEGKDLRGVLKALRGRDERLGYARSASIAADMCRGLGYAHSRFDRGQPLDIVHRDVSPHNVLISYSGDVKVTDFGIAKAASRLTKTSTGMVKGKIAYMSPEQASGEPIDHRTDQFAVGLVLYEMLAGQRAYTGDSEMEILKRAIIGTIPPIAEVCPDIPQSLATVVARSTARHPGQRYPNMAAMDEALHQVIFNLAPAAVDLDVGAVVRRLFEQQSSYRPQTEQLPAVSDLPPFDDDPPDPSAVWQKSEDGETPVSEVAATAALPVAEAVADAGELVGDEVGGATTTSPSLAELLNNSSPSALVPTQAPAIDRSGSGAELVQPSGTESVALVPPRSPLPKIAGGGAAILAVVAGVYLMMTRETASGEPETVMAAVVDASAVSDAGRPDLRGPDRFVPDLAQPDIAKPDRTRKDPAPPNGSVKPRYGSLLVHADGPWAEVYIDGVKKGDTPLLIKKLRAGTYKLRLYNPELRREKSRKVKIRPGKKEEVTIKLR